MTTNRTSLDEFINQIESLFGKKLTFPATQAATDFWNHWESFADLISRRQLSAHVDPFNLAHNFPKYRRYQTWKGGGIALLVLGLATFWFFWPIGVALLVASIVLRFYGNRIRFKDAKVFAEEVMREATLNPAETGYARLCAHYIAGIVEIATPAASAHWPQHPSNVITRTRTFIETGETQQSPPPLQTYRGMVEMDDLIRKSLDVHNILTQYIEIHNNIFKSSLRRFIPIPSVFQAINFGKHYGSLSELADELKYSISDVDDRNGFARALIEYTQALVQTIVLLRDMCGNLYNKSQGEVSSYSKKQYQADLDAYNFSVERYQSLGTRLNQYLR